jgi:NSS family neurotransmitter:Na+ symporter
MAFAKISPRWEWLGWWTVIFVMYGIVLYYAVVIAWCVSFLVFALTLAWGGDPNAFFFQRFLGLTGGPQELGDVRLPILASLLVVWLINWVIVFFGIERGIERANKIFMPLLFLLTAVLVIWTLTLPGAEEGLSRYLFQPDFRKLSDPKVWIDAYAQTFFTLSLGFGIMIAYASYLPRKSDINTNAAITCLVDTAYSLFAGLAVFGTLGYMAHATGKPFEEVVQKSIGLAFVAYPQAISLLPSFARLFGVLFFLTLVVAGVASAISILEAFTAAVIDKFHYSRRSVISVLAVTGFVGGVIFTTGGGMHWLDIVDHFLSGYGLFIACLLQCLLIGWIFGAARLREYVNGLSVWKVGRWWDWSIRYLIPGILLILLVSGLVKDFAAPYYGHYSLSALVLLGWGWLAATLVAALFVAVRRWRRSLHH